MSFGWLGTFRQGQWKAFRTFILNERRDVEKRIAVIEAELERIGKVTVFYREKKDSQGNIVITEQRAGFAVTAKSSLAKLCQAYIALGGNPLDISLFLTPDSTIIFTDENNATVEVTPQPYEGVVAPRDGIYTTGVFDEGGTLTWTKDLTTRLGNSSFLEDSRPASLVGLARKWTNQSIREKRNDIEARIIKLCDLREQLLTEISDMILAVGGTIPALPSVDEEQYEKNLNVAALVAEIDSVFYTKKDDGSFDFNAINAEGMKQYRSLLLDIPEEEDNTAL